MKGLLRMISFIVPAHNEEGYVGRTVQAIHGAARVVGREYEVLVVDDSSTDGTAEVARRNGAEVVRAGCRQIAGARNTGARAARGEYLFFVDADTLVGPQAVGAALRAMENGAAGGGVPARFDRRAPLYAHLLLGWMGLVMRLAGLCGGACMFCTRAAFAAAGGYDERLYGAEDAAMSWALGRVGRFVVPWRLVVTSCRRTHGVRGARMLAGLIAMAFFPQMLRRRSRVGKIWYESRREEGDSAPGSAIERALNAVLLFVVLAIIVPWRLIPASIAPLGRPLGEARWAMAIFSCHFGLVLWPCGYHLVRRLFWQGRWGERVKVAGLIVLCLFGAWGSSTNVAWFWMWVLRGVGLP